MSENTYSTSSISEEDLKERIDIGIAFLVLLFMGALGAYLMSDSEEQFFGAVSADNNAAGLGSGSLDSGLGDSAYSSSDALTRSEQQAQARANRQSRIGPTPDPVAPVDAPLAASAVPALEETMEEKIEEEWVPDPVPAALPEVVAQEVVAQEIAPAVEPEPIFEPVAVPAPEAVPAVVPEAAVPEAAVAEAVVTEEEAAVLQQATSNVSFLTGSATLTEASRTILDDLAELLRARPDTRLSVIGYTDSQGDPDENVALSFARAEACRDYLLARGASVGQVDSAGMGQRKPIGDNSTAEGRRKNRRVEFTLLR